MGSSSEDADQLLDLSSVIPGVNSGWNFNSFDESLSRGGVRETRAEQWSARGGRGMSEHPGSLPHWVAAAAVAVEVVHSFL
jgi:hypothetical protein